MESAHPEKTMPARSSGRMNSACCDSCPGTLDDVEWLLEKIITHRQDSEKKPENTEEHSGVSLHKLGML
jgi:hypothetical protein